MPYPTARSESGLAGRRSSAPMKRNECGTEEDLLPYYALFGLPRKLRTLEKTLESIPKAGRRIPGWATFVMPGSCSPKSPGHRKRSDLSYPSSSRSTGRMGRTTPQSWRTGSTSRHRTSHTALTSATAICSSKEDRDSLGRDTGDGEPEQLDEPGRLSNSEHLPKRQARWPP